MGQILDGVPGKMTGTKKETDLNLRKSIYEPSEKMIAVEFNLKCFVRKF